VQIDPHAWFGTIPLTILMVAAYFQPADGGLKQLWQDIVQFEADTWLRLGWSDPQRSIRLTEQLQVALYWMAVGAIGVGSWLSLHTFWMG
jgi:hypothetical protein